jgi:hypothetical protein
MQKILVPEKERANIIGVQKVKFQDNEYFHLLASDRVQFFSMAVTGDPTTGVLVTDLEELDGFFKGTGLCFADIKERGDVFHRGEVIGDKKEIIFLEDVVIEFY